MALNLILVPLLLSGVAYLLPSERWRPWLLPLGGLAHLVLVVLALGRTGVSALEDWLVLDALGKVVLGLLSVLFFLCSLYAPGYLLARRRRPNRVLCACLLASLAMMTLVTLSHHLGLMWVAIEATTLTTAPCIYFNRNARSLTATWNYLVICSVGIALALLGSFFLAYAALYSQVKTAPGLAQTPASPVQTSLLFDDLIARARQRPGLSPPWLHAAFILLLVGYGTKMGLAPVHTWKPDAYGEAPGLVGAILAGGVTSCAFLAILRVYQICSAAGEADFARRLLIALGLLSMAFGAVFMVRQRDFKRLLAYSGIEHMGILVIGVGVGAFYGALLHLVNSALTKGAMFLAAGNIHRAYGSKHTGDVRGALKVLPLSAGILLAGFLAITGSPPFGPFVSEFTIVSATLASDRAWVAGPFLGLLAVAFIGMGATVLKVVQGEPAERVVTTRYRDRLGTGLAMVVFLALVLLLGICIPEPLERLLRSAAEFVELH